MSRFATAWEFERWFREEVAAGRPPDALRPPPIADETERFWSRVLPGAEHDYWQGAWYFRRNDGSSQHARRWLLSHLLDRPLGVPHEIVETSCDEPRCIRGAHLQIRRHRMSPVGEAEAIFRIRSTVRLLGRMPTRQEWARTGMPSPRALERIFGSVPAAFDAAGFDPAPRGGGTQNRLYSDDEIRAAVRDVTAELGYVPTRSWWEREKRRPSHHTIQRRFGSIEAALDSR